jgi:hypothetical protein
VFSTAPSALPGAFEVLTLGQVGAVQARAGQPWPTAIGDYTYNDQLLRDVEVPLNKTGEWPKRFLELLVLALALGHYEKTVKIEDRVYGDFGKQQAPDFFIALASGQVVGAEVSRLTDEQRTASFNLTQKLNDALANEFATNGALSDRFQDVSLSIQVAIRETAGYNSRSLLASMINRLQNLPPTFIRPGAIDRVRLGDDHLLCKHSFSLVFNDRHSKWTEITPHLPDSDVNAEAAIVRLIDRKRALKYATNGHPLWLAIGIADPWGQFTYPIEAFAQKSYAIAPFERMIVTDNTRATTTIGS